MAEFANAIEEMGLRDRHLRRHIHPRIVVERYCHNHACLHLSRQARLRSVNRHPKGCRRHASVRGACVSKEEGGSPPLVPRQMMVGPRINSAFCVIQKYYKPLARRLMGTYFSLARCFCMRRRFFSRIASRLLQGTNKINNKSKTRGLVTHAEKYLASAFF